MEIQFGTLRRQFLPWQPAMGQVFSTLFALDTETTAIVGQKVPTYVMGAVSDGAKGYFLSPASVHAFLLVHRNCPLIFHNSGFDLAVLQALLDAQHRPLDVYEWVDRHQVWDVMVLHKLHGLCTAGHTYQGTGQSTLERCVELYLGVVLAKDLKDGDGDDLRTSWAKWQGRPPGKIDPIYLEYLALDVLGTFGCYKHLVPRIRHVVENARNAFGYVHGTWLAQQQERFGLQTHDLQVKALISLEEIERTGFGLDLADRAAIVKAVQAHHDELREELRQGGYLEGEKGCDKALQALIRRAAQEYDLDIPRTATGRYSTTEQSLNQLAAVSAFFARFKEFRQTRTLLKSFLAKMGATRIHPHYDFLKNTGRTGSRGPNIQGFPKKSGKKGKISFDLRRCFVPAPGKIFYVADYASIELRTLSQALITQFDSDSAMARAINAGQDLHRLVAARMKATRLPNAAAVLTDPVKFAAVVDSVTAEERGGAKPANFGLPAGMGVATLKGYARAQYDQPYSDEDAQAWKDAWLASFPEMEHYLKDEVDVFQALAERLSLTPQGYADATGEPIYGDHQERNSPAGWLGGMAFKVLKDTAPKKTKTGVAYGQAVLDYFWDRLQSLASGLDAAARSSLVQRQPSFQLYFAVKKLVNRAGVFTITGRLRANATFSARRNTIFQGAAADGVKLALWQLWRAGFPVVAFIHDEVVVEVEETADLPAVKRQIDGILVSAMREVCPDMVIEVEGCFRRRWGKDKADEVPVVGHDDAANRPVDSPFVVPAATGA
jgi:DNA polymerase I-like protein with 3'-5' exonuclease and polymerase domains